ncbi:plastocyanin/azurin family copper-binding protein [Haloarchaeobius amylolyticus]|uniref:plastocyanin/azurin family copper-binding protein n=1 Tax=Haloarchaeobius amylolyticus TaxID=1198296 RepID=UPI0022702376|nr:plastocyanin/azurin family copper-binding protein [Haloarchaeobius amylolyticus]
MTDSPSPATRRTVLKAAGGASLLALAGCLGGDGAGDATSTDTTADEQESTDTTDGSGEKNDEQTDDGHDHGHSGAPESPSKQATVTMKTTDSGQHFDPHVVWVEQGGTVTFDLESGAHSATAYAPANDKPRRIPEDAESWDSGTLSETGKTFEHTFETTGVYDYYCIPHEGMGMLGSVIVGEPDTEGQPGLTEPQSELPEGARSKITQLNETCMEVLGGGHHDGTSTGTDDGHDHDETSTGTDDGHDHDETSTGTDDGHDH